MDPRSGSTGGVTRLTITVAGEDPRNAALLADAHALGLSEVSGIEIAEIVFLDGSLDDDDRALLDGVLVEPLLQRASWDPPPTTEGRRSVETVLQPGVTDPAAEQVRRVAGLLGIDVVAAATGRRYEIAGALDDDQLTLLVDRLLANPVVERWATPGSTLRSPRRQRNPCRSATSRCAISISIDCSPSTANGGWRSIRPSCSPSRRTTAPRAANRRTSSWR